MRTIKVYRLEIGGEGPYGDFFDWLMSDAAVKGDESALPSYISDPRWDRHPSPMESGITRDFDRTVMRFGFESVDDLVNWFMPESDDAMKLTKLGFKVLEFEIEERYTLKGMGQMIFNIFEAKLVRHMSPMEYIYGR